MLASEFINTMAFGILKGISMEDHCKDIEKTYEDTTFFLPRVYCKDGFSISLQVNNGNYCSSENGTRAFGLSLERIEWGYPSQEIDGVKYNAEKKFDTTHTVGGYVEVALIDELCESHGGIDLKSTLEKSCR